MRSEITAKEYQTILSKMLSDTEQLLELSTLKFTDTIEIHRNKTTEKINDVATKRIQYTHECVAIKLAEYNEAHGFFSGMFYLGDKPAYPKIDIPTHSDLCAAMTDFLNTYCDYAVKNLNLKICDKMTDSWAWLKGQHNKDCAEDANTIHWCRDMKKQVQKRLDSAMKMNENQTLLLEDHDMDFLYDKS